MADGPQQLVAARDRREGVIAAPTEAFAQDFEGAGRNEGDVGFRSDPRLGTIDKFGVLDIVERRQRRPS